MITEVLREMKGFSPSSPPPEVPHALRRESFSSSLLMASSSTSIVVPPPSVPPDLLFLHPLDPVSPSGFVTASLSPSCPPSRNQLAPIDVAHIPAEASDPKINLKDSWVSKVRATFQPLSKIASPTFTEDGTPSIRAPDSITLGSSILWKDHLVAFFHGTPPSTAKIFADLNPIWGKNGQITVKHHSEDICMIYVPCSATRQWALDVGFWHLGNCSFTLALWTPSLDLSPMKLVQAPLWVLFKKVPPELWSIDGFSTIASGVGNPVHSEFSALKPYTNGIIKLKVIIDLEKKRPPSVKVTDNLGNSVTVIAEYPRLPPKCNRCKEFGHLELRCPLARSTRDIPKPGDFIGPLQEEPRPPQISLENGVRKDSPGTKSASAPVSPTVAASGGLVRSTSLTHFPRCSSLDPSSGGWLRTVKRSKVRLDVSSHPGSVGIRSKLPVTESQFAEEEELINEAQAIIRRRISVLKAASPKKKSTALRRNARKIQRQKQLLLSCSEPDGVDIETSVRSSSESVNTLTSAVGGRALPCFVPPVLD
ncbi:unnamed protein product [Microthlaspi erraticum]|uniref:DUF4283 domain-containing protein n=1 Tax=Microthlaspi erraticum TaxID=1685480 RepID=A0A6D2IIB4_9BRAS|nr:unnamed protein product [Microthlaspi erraticum]